MDHDCYTRLIWEVIYPRQRFNSPGQKTIPISSENSRMVSVAAVNVGGVHKGGDGVVLLSFTAKILS